MDKVSKHIIVQPHSVIAVLRPAAHAQLSPLGNWVRLERTDIVNISQESVEKFLMSALNSFIECNGSMDNYIVTSSFYIDPTESSGYSIFTVLELEGIDIPNEIIEYFKSAVLFLCEELICQPSLFVEYKINDGITHEDALFFQAEASKFLQKYGGQRVKKEFYVQTGFEDREGFIVKDNFATIENSPIVNKIEEGMARADGCSLSGNEIYLITVNGNKLNGQKTKFQCLHKSHYDTIAQALLTRANLRFTAQRLKTPSAKNETLSLITLDLIASNE